MYTEVGVDQDDYWTPQEVEQQLLNELSLLKPEHRVYFRHAVFDRTRNVLQGDSCSLYFSQGKVILI